MLTAVALSVSQLGPDEVLHPERMADAAPRVRVALAVTRAVQLTDWKGRSEPEVTERQRRADGDKLPVYSGSFKLFQTQLQHYVTAQPANCYFLIQFMHRREKRAHTHFLCVIHVVDTH